jgi:hypothetical protein
VSLPADVTVSLQPTSALMAKVGPSDDDVRVYKPPPDHFCENFLCCPYDCTVYCCMPICVCCVCPLLAIRTHKELKKQGGGPCFKDGAKAVECKFMLSNMIQRFMLLHPVCGSVVGCCGLVTTLANLHDIRILGGSMYKANEDLYGPSFMACGKVLTTEPQLMHRYLTSPQGAHAASSQRALRRQRAAAAVADCARAADAAWARTVRRLCVRAGRGAHLHGYRLLKPVMPTASADGAGPDAFKKGDNTFLLSMPNSTDPNDQQYANPVPEPCTLCPVPEL